MSTLFQGEVQANQEKEVEWQAGHNVAGLFIIQLQTPNQTLQQKVISKQ